MRVGLIADLHGNKLALDAVLDQLDRQQVSSIICLGDVAVLGPDPAGVTRVLRERQVPVVRGNTDAWLCGPPHADPVFAELTGWTRGQLAAEDLAWLERFPPTLTLTLADGVELLACHGSPRSHDEVLSALTPDAVVADALRGHEEPMVAAGHTHIQLLRRFGERWLINPGSAGLPGIGPGTNDLPVNTEAAWAEYAIIDVTSPGLVAVNFHRVSIDLSELFAGARSSGMPHLDWWLRLWGAPPQTP